MAGISILLIEDELIYSDDICHILRRAGYQVQVVTGKTEAIEVLTQKKYDVSVVNILLPGMDEVSFINWIHDQCDTPVIIVTTKKSGTEKIIGLDIGADDYILRPVNPSDLVSKVRAVLRRTLSATQPIPEPPLVYNNLRIDPTTRLVYLDENEIFLTAKEFEMLLLLAKNPHQVFSREQLLERIWGHSEYIDPGTVTVHIRRLREKIEADPAQPAHVITVWGVGYKFSP